MIQPMLRQLEQQVFLKQAPGRIHYLARPDYPGASGLARQVLDQMAQEFQVVPPVTLHLVLPRMMAGVWGVCREALLAGEVDRIRREAIAAVTSQINTCPFCVDVHTSMLHGAHAHQLARSVLEANHAEGHGSTLLEWAGATLDPSAPILRRPPFSREEAPQLIGTAVAFHYVNRMVNIFLDDSPVPLPRGFKRLNRIAGRFVGWAIGRRIMQIPVEPGGALLDHSDAPLPDEFGWARENSAVARAFANFAEVAEQTGRQFIPQRVRGLVLEQVNQWDGQPQALGQQWLEQVIRPLPADQQPMARLALLTALASYRVDEQTIAAFRELHPDDESLLGVTAWASYVAARRISSWLSAPDPA